MFQPVLYDPPWIQLVWLSQRQTLPLEIVVLQSVQHELGTIFHHTWELFSQWRCLRKILRLSCFNFVFIFHILCKRYVTLFNSILNTCCCCCWAYSYAEKKNKKIKKSWWVFALYKNIFLRSWSLRNIRCFLRNQSLSNTRWFYGKKKCHSGPCNGDNSILTKLSVMPFCRGAAELYVPHMCKRIFRFELQ